MPGKGFSILKQKKWTPHIFYIILHIHISLVRNFSSNWQFWFFGPNLPKKVFPVENRENEHYHGILHIWISLGTKFQLKLIILSFWAKFTQKRYFQLKTEQAVQGLQAFAFCVVNVNWTVVFKHFEDIKDLNILNFSNVEIISKVMIKFRSKFQFQISLQFYRTVEKVETCDGNGQKFWQVPPSFQPLHFVYYFVFSWLRFKHTDYKGTLI